MIIPRKYDLLHAHDAKMVFFTQPNDEAFVAAHIAATAVGPLFKKIVLNCSCEKKK